MIRKSTSSSDKSFETVACAEISGFCFAYDTKKSITMTFRVVCGDSDAIT